MRASERHIGRMVPEGDATQRSRSLATLGFSDRVLGPYVRHAQQSPMRMFGSADAQAEADTSREREIEATSWIFPRPWYMDELDWLHSTRMSASAAESSAARSARVAGMRGRGPAGIGLGAVARAASAAPSLALDLVAPSFGRAGGMADSRQRAALAVASAAAVPIGARSAAVQQPFMARPTALRAWSPLVPFAAVQAAELMAGVLTPAARSGDADDDVPWQGSEARTAPTQELVAPFVTPRELAASRPAESTARAASRSASQATRPESSQASQVPEALRNRLQNALRRLEVQRAQTRAAGQTPGQPGAAPAAARPGVSGASTRPATALADASAPAAATTGATAPAGAAAPAAIASSPAAARTTAAAAPVPARERALELMLHSALAGRTGQDMAPVTGPRLALPAGLGGLIVGLRAARTVARPVASPSRATEMRPSTSTIVAPGAASGAATVGVQTGAAAAELPLIGRAPGANEFGQPAGATARTPGMGHSSAYRAVMQTRPAALAHIAWSDRWLARFAGASTDALAALEATTSPAANTPASRAFSGQAPEPVFLSVSLAEREAATRAATAGTTMSAPAAMRAGRAAPPTGRTAAVAQPSTAASTGPALPQAAAANQRVGAGASTTAPALAAAPRIADDATVSDEMFAAIAAAASRAPRRPGQPARGGDTRAASAGPSRAAAAAPNASAGTGEAQNSPAGQELDQVSGGAANHVDRLLAASPAAPGPGMRVALASSPVAPALSALLPLLPSPSFDVRAMHGVELASAYLAGVIEPGGMATTAARPWPMLSPLRWEQGGATPMQGQPSAVEPGLWTEMPMVAPAAASTAPGASADASRHSAAQRLASGSAPAASVAVTHAASAAAGASVQAHRAVSVQDRARPITGPGPLLPPAQPAASGGPALSLGAGQAAAGRAAPGAASGEAARTGSALTAAGARAVAAPAAAAFAHGPGSAAAQAESWAMVREQAAADLALDYVSPELLVAAQAYGFGPAEAAQAARLSSSGRTGLAALAAAVDLRFIDAFAAARSGEWPAASSSSLSSSGSSPGARSFSSIGSSAPPARASGGVLDAASQGVAGSSPAGSVVSAPAAGSAASAQAAAPLAASALASTAPGSAATPMTAVPGAGAKPAAGARSLGMPLRTPRGAFLWPHATIMAMNLQLADADAAQPLSLAALDLLAANAVAQMGALVAPEQAPAAAIQQAGTRSSGAATGAGRDARPATSTSPAAMGAGQGQAPSATALRMGLASATPLAPDVLGAVAQRDSLLAAGAPPATYVTPVLDFDLHLGLDLGLDLKRGLGPDLKRGLGPDLKRGLGPDLGRAASTTFPAAGAGVAGTSAPGSRTAWAGSTAVPGPTFQEGMTDTPAAAAAALGHRSSLPSGFEALYVALSRSPAGRSLSPAVRAARALALAGSFVASASGSRAGATPTSPGGRARAAAAWAVMPTVLASGADAFWPGADAFAASAPDMPTLAGAELPGSERPERQLMTARAGESLQSFVAPGEAATSVSADRPPSAAASRSRGAVQRVPTAAQPLVQTSQSRAQVAAVQDMIRSAQQKRSSGDNSIPAWFEEAARRMFQEGSDGGGISLAEMTLVTAAPARLVAASPKSASSSASSRPPDASAGSESYDAEPTANVEQMAREVYAEICRMIEMARSRNGNTWR